MITVYAAVVGILLVSTRQWRTRGSGGSTPPPFQTEPLFLKWSVQTVQVQCMLLFQNSVTEFAPHHTEAKSAGWHSDKRHCYQWKLGQIQGDVVDVPPTTHF